ncbi:MAG: hypothetical protein K5686_01675 [Lachnospiraceae bacterium]|nr:hypothetical protein [Lachnospiraceae bacterium]
MKKTIADKEKESIKNVEAAVWYIIAALLFIYTLFLILKINGVWDYTSKYGIEYIADGEGYNSVMMCFLQALFVETYIFILQ